MYNNGRMVNGGLTWSLERHMATAKFQNGFRRHRCTVNIIVTSIGDAFVDKQAFGLSLLFWGKVYDTTWYFIRYKTGICGRLPIFICYFLSDSHFKVRVRNMIMILSLLTGGRCSTG